MPKRAGNVPQRFCRQDSARPDRCADSVFRSDLSDSALTLLKDAGRSNLGFASSSGRSSGESTVRRRPISRLRETAMPQLQSDERKELFRVRAGIRVLAEISFSTVLFRKYPLLDVFRSSQNPTESILQICFASRIRTEPGNRPSFVSGLLSGTLFDRARFNMYLRLKPFNL